MNRIFLFFIFLTFSGINSDGKAILRFIGPEKTNIRDFQISDDGKHLYAAVKNVVHIYDIESGDQIGTVNMENNNDIYSLSLSADNSLLISGFADGTITIYNLDSGHAVHTSHTETIITSLDINPEMNLIVAGTFDGEVLIIDIDGNVKWRNRLHEDIVSCVTISSDSRFMGSSGMDGRILVTWLNKKDKSLLVNNGRKPCSGIAFNGDGSGLIASYYNGRLVRWRINQMERFTLANNFRFKGWVTSVDFHHNNLGWAACTTNGNLVINTGTGQQYSRNFNKILNKVKFISADDSEVRVMVSIHNMGLAVASVKDMKVSLASMFL
jgi:WD40 repeat protein